MKENVDRAVKALKLHTSAARKAGGGRRSTARAADQAQLAKLREWPRANGHQVSDRGREGSSVHEAYQQAN